MPGDVTSSTPPFSEPASSGNPATPLRGRVVIVDAKYPFELPDGLHQATVIAFAFGEYLGTQSYATEDGSTALRQDVILKDLFARYGNQLNRRLEQLGSQGLNAWPSRGYSVPQDHHASPTVAVVICTTGTRPALSQTIQSVKRQDPAPDQIILVDNRPNRSGIDADALRAQGLCVVAEPRQGLSYARNRGMEVATTEVVVFTDDDIVAAQGWLDALLRPLRETEVAAVTGQILPLEVTTPAQRFFEEFGGYSKGYRTVLHPLDPVPNRIYPYTVGAFGSGANSAFRREVLSHMGGFSPLLGTGTPARGGEDLDAYLNVVTSGRTLVYEPSAIVQHGLHADLSTLRRQLFEYGVGVSAALVKRLIYNPRERAAILRALPRALAYMADPSSRKNQRKSSEYPTSLTVAEWAGILCGPAAFLRSAIRARKT